jgi:hypothetical protein
MPRKPTDWKQKYENSIIQTKRDVENIFDLRKELDDIQERHKALNKEFDKAVAINKQFQETIVEQRGIIHYLEGKKNGN